MKPLLRKITTSRLLFAKLTKVDKDKRIVEGIASSETVDSEGESVSSKAVEEAMPDFMEFANLREMHQLKAAGNVLQWKITEDGELWIQVKVVDDGAWKKVKEGVYQGFSIGGSKWGDGANVDKVQIDEISLVDRPSNPDSTFSLVKAARTQDPETRGLLLEAVQEKLQKISKDQARLEKIALDLGPDKVQELPDLEKAPNPAETDAAKAAGADNMAKKDELLKRIDTLRKQYEASIALLGDMTKQAEDATDDEKVGELEKTFDEMDKAAQDDAGGAATEEVTKPDTEGAATTTKVEGEDEKKEEVAKAEAAEEEKKEEAEKAARIGNLSKAMGSEEMGKALGNMIEGSMSKAIKPITDRLAKLEKQEDKSLPRPIAKAIVVGKDEDGTDLSKAKAGEEITDTHELMKKIQRGEQLPAANMNKAHGAPETVAR